MVIGRATAVPSMKVVAVVMGVEGVVVIMDPCWFRTDDVYDGSLKVSAISVRVAYAAGLGRGGICRADTPTPSSSSGILLPRFARKSAHFALMGVQYRIRR